MGKLKALYFYGISENGDKIGELRYYKHNPNIVEITEDLHHYIR